GQQSTRYRVMGTGYSSFVAPSEGPLPYCSGRGPCYRPTRGATSGPLQGFRVVSKAEVVDKARSVRIPCSRFGLVGGDSVAPAVSAPTRGHRPAVRGGRRSYTTPASDTGLTGAS